MPDSFPRQYARTRGFNLGLPRSFQVASDGSRVAFLRTPAGDDSLASLWVYDVAQGAGALRRGRCARGHDHRRRTGPPGTRRERQTGVVTFAADPELRTASFVVGQDLIVADLESGSPGCWRPLGPRSIRVPTPRDRVAYVTGGALRVIDLAGGDDARLAR